MNSETLHPTIRSGALDVLISVHPQDVTKAWSMSPEIRQVVHVARGLDKALFLAAAEQPDFFAHQLIRPWETQAVEMQARLVSSFLHQERYGVAVPIFFGTTRQYDLLNQHAFGSTQVLERDIPIMITRSHGNTLVPPSVFSSDSSELIEHASIKGVVDDLLDEGSTVALASIYLAYGHTDIERISPVERTLLLKLARVKAEHFPVSSNLYEEIARELFQKKKTVVFFAFSKNLHFYKAIQKVANEDDTRWGKWQRLALTPVRDLPPHAWVMGEGIDTGKRGTELREEILKIAPDLADDPRILPTLNALQGQILRLGATGRGIIALKPAPPVQQYGELSHWYATHWVDELRRL